MRSSPPPSSRNETRAAVTGHRFTFTLDEESRLYRLTNRIQSNLRRKRAGWRVCVVQDVTDMHVVIQGALDRSDRPEAINPDFPPPLG
ncbi:MAG: hypothetical protein BMS9Abin29_2513 [Gemmatimonadota bacterium]|nr:MAG: hypothetical protein BMS9Abin29_2513 [Gemmatimonadota bacterium]